VTTTYLHKRQTEALEELLMKRHQVPTSNARMRQTSFDIPARLQDKVPYNDVQLQRDHEDDLDNELRYRHVLPYLPMGPENKRVNPVAERDVLDGISYDALNFSQKKFSLIADEERMWKMNWCHDNDFDLEKLDMKQFDSKTFTVFVSGRRVRTP
jgi:hypothetical protein